MKLFSAKEVASTRQITTNQEINRLASLNKEIDRKRKELNNLELDLKTAIKLQQDWNTSEKANFTNEIAVLKKEVLDLEDRRKAALIPLETKWEEIENISKALAERESFIKEEIESLEEKSELLQEGLSKVEEQEHYLNAQATRQKLTQEGLDLQKVTLTTRSKELTLLMGEELKANKLKQGEISKILSLVEAKEKAIKTLEQTILEKEKELISREIALKDRYETLERTIKRQNL